MAQAWGFWEIEPRAYPESILRCDMEHMTAGRPRAPHRWSPTGTGRAQSTIGGGSHGGARGRSGAARRQLGGDTPGGICRIGRLAGGAATRRSAGWGTPLPTDPMARCCCCCWADADGAAGPLLLLPDRRRCCCCQPIRCRAACCWRVDADDAARGMVLPPTDPMAMVLLDRCCRRPIRWRAVCCCRLDADDAAGPIALLPPTDRWRCCRWPMALLLLDRCCCCRPIRCRAVCRCRVDADDAARPIVLLPPTDPMAMLSLADGAAAVRPMAMVLPDRCCWCCQPMARPLSLLLSLPLVLIPAPSGGDA
ncbi:hypothetical protein Caci_0929 [Catenulispora acidiphila DSM 44928]|uniref:Uncharacterized protein n=1 Tax=Catenulispora acidiphila (strain DSM 44928 / JCM 14897 / NBRC 102108 / NRRL B-24433 / ID139908) TaxID=479433 RepID=C7Q2L9_CATAD|nr:hypothetical protein Caci_0929 [Catenulispora acidiphila DSM 44928]